MGAYPENREYAQRKKGKMYIRIFNHGILHFWCVHYAHLGVQMSAHVLLRCPDTSASRTRD